MATPKRKCKECGTVGKWTTYLIWDKNEKKQKQIDDYRHKWWLCPSCDKEG
jgi:hypothetical protein